MPTSAKNSHDCCRFDARRQAQSETDPLGHRTSYLWNAEGSRRAVIDALGHRTTWHYDAANQNTAPRVEYRGQHYLFATAESKAAFEKDPAKHAVLFGSAK